MKGRQNCGACWGRKRSCDSGRGNDQCNHCAQKLKAGTPILNAQPLPLSALQQLLFQPKAGLDFDPDDCSSNSDSTLHLRIHTSDNQIINIDSSYNKNFSDQNEMVMQSLEETLLPIVATQLSAKDSNTSYIQYACLVGGYLGVLGRSTFQERLQTFIDGAAGGGVQSLNTVAHLIYLMMWRMAHFTEDILVANRVPENAQSQFAYAAAVILDFELRSFQSSLDSDSITALQSSSRAQKMLWNWISDVRRELQSRVCKGCRRYTRWSSVVSGSLKTLKEEQKLRRQLWISVSEQQNFVSLAQTNRWPYPTFTTDPLSSQEDPTTSGENHTSQTPEFHEDVVSFHGPSSSAYMVLPTTYRPLISFADHHQFNTATPSPFITGSGHASNAEYAAGPGYMDSQMHSWTSFLNSDVEQDFTHADFSSMGPFSTGQRSDVSMLPDTIPYNPLLQEPFLDGDYPTNLILDDD